jgi:hypothetical protein
MPTRHYIATTVSLIKSKKVMMIQPDDRFSDSGPSIAISLRIAPGHTDNNVSPIEHGAENVLPLSMG